MPQLFLDMDGVLADFDAGHWRAFGAWPHKEGFVSIGEQRQPSMAVDWEAVRKAPHFYRDLPPMPDMEVLWESVDHLSPILLSGVPAGSFGLEAADNKREWVDRWLGRDVRAIFCRPSEKSLKMTGRGDVLVDDGPKYQHLWEGAGGTFVAHRSARASVKELYKLDWIRAATPAWKVPDRYLRGAI